MLEVDINVGPRVPRVLPNSPELRFTTNAPNASCCLSIKGRERYIVTWAQS
jgi:hypothetical protein